MLRDRVGVEHPKPGLLPESVSPDPRPVQDEWGFYDPEQAGLEAVLRKLKPENGAAAPAPDTPDK